MEKEREGVRAGLLQKTDFIFFDELHDCTCHFNICVSGSRTAKWHNSTSTLWRLHMAPDCNFSTFKWRKETQVSNLKLLFLVFSSLNVYFNKESASFTFGQICISETSHRKFICIYHKCLWHFHMRAYWRSLECVLCHWRYIGITLLNTQWRHSTKPPPNTEHCRASLVLKFVKSAVWQIPWI